MLNQSKKDRGSSLVSVLVLMLVLTLFATVVAGTVASTSRSLSSSRATSKARQAADAGIAAAVAAFQRTKDCTQANLTEAPSESDQTAPQYHVACATSGDTVTFTSTGSEAGSSDAIVEAEYRFEITTVEGDADHMTFFSGATFTYETDSLSESGLLRITIAKGDFICQNSVPADVIVAGNFRGNGQCDVEGDVWAGGQITSSNNDVIHGDATSAATSGTNNWYGSIGGDFVSGTNVELAWDSSRLVGGSIRSSGDVTLHDARVGGDVVAPAGKKVTASWKSTDLPAGSHAQVGGSIVRPGTVAAPDAPAYLEWRDYDFNEADWGGYLHRVLTTSECSGFNSWPSQGWKDLAAITSPTIIDARACTGLSSNAGGVSVTISTNLVFLAPSLDLTTLTIKAADGTDPKIWFIVPDTVDDDEPRSSCGVGTITLNHMDIEVPSFLYTPGCINVTGGGTFTGTMYSGGFSYGGQIDMLGQKVPFPGGGTSGGSDSGTGSGLQLTLIRQRDL